MGVIDEGVAVAGSDGGVRYTSEAGVDAGIGGFVSKLGIGDLALAGEVESWEAGLDWPLERRRMLLRPLARRPFDPWSSLPWRENLARHPKASISAWTGRKACSQS